MREIAANRDLGRSAATDEHLTALTPARRYAESILATVRQPLVVLDSRLRVVTANPAFDRLFGADPGRTEGCSLFELGRREWHIPELRQRLEQILSLNHTLSDFKVVHDVAGGGHKAWLLNARLLAQAADAPPLLLLSMDDVSERERVDERRRQRAVQLGAADRSKDEFLAVLAHELHNPLAAIRTAAEILSSPGVPASASEKARVIIDRQINNMTRQIDDLLDVARITQGKISLQLVPADLTAVLRRALDVVEPQVSERNQQLSVRLPSEPCYVRGDTTRLEQAFGNLLNNASKFTGRGGRIWLRAKKREAADGASEVLVYVRDEGTGIVAEKLPHIFDLFRQAGESPHHAQGLGVGLALVRRIIELHGGRVSVESAGVDRGCEFVVSLPLLDESIEDTHKP